MTTMSISVLWEGELSQDAHRDIAYLLRATYGNEIAFAGARSWAGVRPELRITVAGAAGVIGHVALRRHFIRVGGTDQLVGELGLLAVHPDLQAQGVGRMMLLRANEILADLRVPFGFTNCADRVARLFASIGWRSLPGAQTRFCSVWQPHTFVTTDYPATVLPVAAAFEDWPDGLLELNGPEV